MLFKDQCDTDFHTLQLLSSPHPTHCYPCLCIHKVCQLAKCSLPNFYMVQKQQILRIKDRIHHKNINKLKNKWMKCDDSTLSVHCVI